MNARPAAERQRQPTEIRRVLLLDAAREVIAERGLFATTVRDIARAGGVSVGTLTYHFSGIAEILRELLEREMAVFYQPIVDKALASDRGLNGLQVVIDCFFTDDARTAAHWRLWLDFWSVSVHDAQYARWQQQTYVRWRADALHLLTLAREQGDLADVDLEACVVDFLALFDGLAVHAYLPRSPLGPDDARRALTAWVYTRTAKE
jgi:AcrR family transcriptional regulator